MMKFLQRLDKSLMLPVACLPVCCILMDIGYALCLATMQGGSVSGVLQLHGTFAAAAVAPGFRAGFSFSAVPTDLVFSASLSAAATLLLIVPLSLAALIIFYVVFHIMITSRNPKPPGRENDDEAVDESKVQLANNGFTTTAQIILEGLGGAGNVTSVDNCITRLRLEVKDPLLVDETKIKSAGIAGVIRPSKTAVQVIVGAEVQVVADEFRKLM